MNKIIFHTLLFIDHTNKSLSTNGLSGNFEQQILSYIKCCESLSKSIKHFTKSTLNVITNDKSYISKHSEILNITQIDFKLNVPIDISFFAAHHKIEVFKYLAELNSTNEYHILIDNDVLCINEIPHNLRICINENIPSYYNITNLHYPAYSRESMVNAIAKVNLENHTSLGLWAGGEFIGGSSNFFKKLYLEINTVWDGYLLVYKSLHHQGDEVVVSAAIEKLLRTETYICDVGYFGGIGRYWSVPTRHIQKSWKAYKDHFMVHLPADKTYLAALKSIDNNIKNKLTQHFVIKSILQKPLHVIKNLIKLLIHR